MLDNFYCKYELMALYQTIITPDGATLKISSSNFINSLLTLAHDYQNYDIRLEGNSDFLEGLANQIYAYNNLHYSTGVQIMVNGGLV